MRSGEPFIFFNENFHVSKRKGTSVVTHNYNAQWLVSYLHDIFAVGTTIAPKVDGRLYDGAEQTGA
jgi:hypothetical protein